eukprot:m.122839 g.122839  ORF g.122839 m.122839 type:complete len:1453 (+) comp9315_c0_seq1:104-4462(+)
MPPPASEIAVVPFTYYDPLGAALRALSKGAVSAALDDHSLAPRTRSTLLETLKALHQAAEGTPTFAQDVRHALQKVLPTGLLYGLFSLAERPADAAHAWPLQNDNDMQTHCALLAAALQSHVLSFLSVERVDATLAAGTFVQSASLADGLLGWLNRVNTLANKTLMALGVPHGLMPVSPYFPRISNLLSSLSDGRALAAVLLFYMPRLLPFATVEYGDGLGEAASLGNIIAVQDAATRVGCRPPFSPEDLLYGCSPVSPAITYWLAMLFTALTDADLDDHQQLTVPVEDLVAACDAMRARSLRPAPRMADHRPPSRRRSSVTDLEGDPTGTIDHPSTWNHRPLRRTHTSSSRRQQQLPPTALSHDGVPMHMLPRWARAALATPGKLPIHVSGASPDSEGQSPPRRVDPPSEVPMASSPVSPASSGRSPGERAGRPPRPTGQAPRAAAAKEHPSTHASGTTILAQSAAAGAVADAHGGSGSLQASGPDTGRPRPTGQQQPAEIRSSLEELRLVQQQQQAVLEQHLRLLELHEQQLQQKIAEQQRAQEAQRIEDARRLLEESRQAEARRQDEERLHLEAKIREEQRREQEIREEQRREQERQEEEHRRREHEAQNKATGRPQIRSEGAYRPMVSRSLASAVVLGAAPGHSAPLEPLLQSQDFALRIDWDAVDAARANSDLELDASMVRRLGLPDTGTDYLTGLSDTRKALEDSARRLGMPEDITPSQSPGPSDSASNIADSAPADVVLPIATPARMAGPDAHPVRAVQSSRPTTSSRNSTASTGLPSTASEPASTPTRSSTNGTAMGPVTPSGASRPGPDAALVPSRPGTSVLSRGTPNQGLPVATITVRQSSTSNSLQSGSTRSGHPMPLSGPKELSFVAPDAGQSFITLVPASPSTSPTLPPHPVDDAAFSDLSAGSRHSATIGHSQPSKAAEGLPTGHSQPSKATEGLSSESLERHNHSQKIKRAVPPSPVPRSPIQEFIAGPELAAEWHRLELEEAAIREAWFTRRQQLAEALLATVQGAGADSKSKSAATSSKNSEAVAATSKAAQVAAAADAIPAQHPPPSGPTAAELDDRKKAVFFQIDSALEVASGKPRRKPILSSSRRRDVDEPATPPRAGPGLATPAARHDASLIQSPSQGGTVIRQPGRRVKFVSPVEASPPASPGREPEPAARVQPPAAARPPSAADLPRPGTAVRPTSQPVTVPQSAAYPVYDPPSQPAQPAYHPPTQGLHRPVSQPPVRQPVYQPPSQPVYEAPTQPVHQAPSHPRPQATGPSTQSHSHAPALLTKASTASGTASRATFSLAAQPAPPSPEPEAPHRKAEPVHTQVAANKTLIRNAVCSPACLGGARVHDEKRAEALQAVDACDAVHFVILLRDPNNPKFRGIYSYTGDGVPRKIYGQGPAVLKPDAIAAFYRYNSGPREFRPMTTTDYAICDAVSLRAACWPKAQPPTR